MILSNQMSRERALEKLSINPYENEIIGNDIEYVKKKLSITDKEFEKIINSNPKFFYDYKTLFPLLKRYSHFWKLISKNVLGETPLIFHYL